MMIEIPTERSGATERGDDGVGRVVSGFTGDVVDGGGVGGVDGGGGGVGQALAQVLKPPLVGHGQYVA